MSELPSSTSQAARAATVEPMSNLQKHLLMVGKGGHVAVASGCNKDVASLLASATADMNFRMKQHVGPTSSTSANMNMMMAMSRTQTAPHSRSSLAIPNELRFQAFNATSTSRQLVDGFAASKQSAANAHHLDSRVMQRNAQLSRSLHAGDSKASGVAARSSLQSKSSNNILRSVRSQKLLKQFPSLMDVSVAPHQQGCEDSPNMKNSSWTSPSTPSSGSSPRKKDKVSLRSKLGKALLNNREKEEPIMSPSLMQMSRSANDFAHGTPMSRSRYSVNDMVRAGSKNGTNETDEKPTSNSIWSPISLRSGGSVTKGNGKPSLRSRFGSLLVTTSPLDSERRDANKGNEDDSSDSARNTTSPSTVVAYKKPPVGILKKKKSCFKSKSVNDISRVGKNRSTRNLYGRDDDVNKSNSSWSSLAQFKLPEVDEREQMTSGEFSCSTFALDDSSEEDYIQASNVCE